MFELFELIVAGTAMSVATAYLGKQAFYTTSDDTNKKKKLDRPMNIYLQHRLDALKELAKMSADIGVTSTNSILVQITPFKKGYRYSFHYQRRPQPFVIMAFDNSAKTIETKYISKLDPRRKDVKETLEKLKTKILEKHGVRTKAVESISATNNVNKKYHELLLRIKHLLVQETVAENEREELKKTIEPMIHEVMDRYEGFYEENKEAFTSKTLDIFYYLEKRIVDFEASAKQKQHEDLHNYFSTMEERAKKLSEE